MFLQNKNSIFSKSRKIIIPIIFSPVLIGLVLILFLTKKNANNLYLTENLQKFNYSVEQTERNYKAFLNSEHLNSFFETSEDKHIENIKKLKSELKILTKELLSNNIVAENNIKENLNQINNMLVDFDKQFNIIVSVIIKTGNQKYGYKASLLNSEKNFRKRILEFGDFDQKNEYYQLENFVVRFSEKPNRKTADEFNNSTKYLMAILKIYLDEKTLTLFAFQKLSENNTADDLPNNSVVRKWWDYMEDIMEYNPDHTPVSISLKEVFHMD